MKTDSTLTGDPTPDMEPMNDEVEAISNGLKDNKCLTPIDTLPANGGMNDAERVPSAEIRCAHPLALRRPRIKPCRSEDYDALLKRVLALESASKAPEAARRV